MRKIVYLLAIAAFGIFSAKAQQVPTSEQIGADKMPVQIEPINAPFSMPQLKAPTFPDRKVNIRESGAKENELCTNVIQKAIDKISKSGGGVVIIPKGHWLTGRIVLRSHVNLHLEDGAELRFSGNIKDYLPAVFTRNEGIELYSLGGFIYADHVSDIALTGKGALIAPPSDCEMYKRVMEGKVIEDFIGNKPLKERVYEGRNGEPIFLPMFFSPTNSKNILVEGVEFRKSLFWNIVPVYCENIIIRGVRVESVGLGRTDGIDIDSSSNVLVEYTTLNCGDDCFTLKAGRCEDGIRVNKPTQNVVIRYCKAMKGGGGVTCGSETAGMIRNVYVHDCVFQDTGEGIRFKTRRNRGGGGENLYYERIRFNIPGPAIKWDMLGQAIYVGQLAERLPKRELTPLTPSYKNIFIKDLIVENASKFINAIGIPETPVENVTIENCQVNSRLFIELSDVRNFTLRNIKATAADSACKMQGVQGLRMDNVDVSVAE